jgi:TIR domain
MGRRIEKTVFISYRTADAPWGVAIFQYLTQHGYDVFIDYDGIASGKFETIIFENIRARAHFLVLLTPTAMEHFGEPSDWMRREIEAALDSERNIVPLMLAGFNFSKPAAASQLIGKLAALKDYQGLEIPKAQYFTSQMKRLRKEFLNVPVDAELHPASESAQEVAKEQKDKAIAKVDDLGSPIPRLAAMEQGPQIQNERGKQADRVPGRKKPKPRFVAKFIEDNPERDEDGCYEICFGVLGFHPGTRLIVFFTDHPDSFPEKGGSLEKALCSVVTVKSQLRRVFVAEREAWDIDGDFMLYAVGVFGEGRTFTLSSMLCDALDAHYSGEFPEGAPKGITEAISNLRDALE